MDFNANMRIDIPQSIPRTLHFGTPKITGAVDDLTDWQVELPSGRYAGGFTMRVMFDRGREQWGSLPPELEAEEKKYE